MTGSARVVLVLFVSSLLVACGSALSLPPWYLRNRSLPFQDCGSSYDIITLNIDNCEDLPCEMELGKSVLVQTFFDDYGKNARYLKHKVSWIFNNVRTDATVTPDPCSDFDDCLEKDIDGKVSWATLLVSSTLPVLKGTMLWETRDERNDKVMCYKVPVKTTYTPS